ncbi:hypothetical protein [Candidatus Berkiella aquae]|uniref:Uncharacterized protein n=1 Tax=Candidatus Berkiella aquae TaxID=295108 RepID=A0A0Q9YK49_9GAMM|nr:hypothetical protein [Candidatus Berkiella aquae]MCS5709979.1 hypothetical protein [Candidatus Berkiella aquae]
MKDNNSALKLLSIKDDNHLTLSLYNQYVTTINLALKQKKQPWLEQLTQEVRSLAHLSTRELLTLLEDSVLPLIQRYEYLQQQADLSQQTLDENQQKLHSLKHEIYQGLHLRCKVSEALHLPRQVDDLKAYAKRNTQISIASLDDDSRLIIYDLLCEAGYDKQILYQDVIAVIPKRSYKTVRKPQAIKKALTQIYQFTHHVNEALKLKPSPPGWFSTQVLHLQQQLQPALSQIGQWPLLPLLWQARYLLYFLLSLGAYALLLQTCSPLAVIILSEKWFALLSSGLFYTVGLLPLWWLLGEKLHHAFKATRNGYLNIKQDQVVEALHLLERSHQLIYHRLSQVIVDITYHDFSLLNEKIESHLQALKTLDAKLQHYSWWERLFCHAQLKSQTAVISKKLCQTETQLQMTVKRMIKHITSRVKEELTLLEKAVYHQALRPVFPANQYNNIKQFIEKYGTKEDVEHYEAQANITHLWCRRLEHFSLREKHGNQHQLMLSQPWGGHIIRKDVMRGWQILLAELGDVNGPSKQALEIHKLLCGKRDMSLEALTQSIEQVAKEKSTILLQKIQMLIFNTLPDRNAAQAKCLSQAQKQLISNWYHQNQTRINWANHIMQQAFADKQKCNRFERLTNTQLARCYELLEGADIYYFAKAQKEHRVTRHNLAKAYFESYQGQSSRAFRLLRFLPEPVKGKLLPGVACKRLTWILTNLNKKVDPEKPFNDVDIEFFLHHDLSKQHALFNVAQMISNSAEFSKPWSANMEKFLASCRNDGLDSGKLLTQYQAKNKRIKTFVLNQHKLKKFLPTLPIKELTRKNACVSR